LTRAAFLVKPHKTRRLKTQKQKYPQLLQHPNVHTYLRRFSTTEPQFE